MKITKAERALLSKVTALYREFTGSDHTTALMDIDSVNEEFNMDWKALLAGSPFDRTHDFAGIYRHLDRETYPAKMGGCFVPRFTRSTPEEEYYDFVGVDKPKLSEERKEKDLDPPKKTTPKELETYTSPIPMIGRKTEILDNGKGLRAVVASVDGKVRGTARPVARKWLVRIDGRLFEPSESLARFNSIPGTSITVSPLKAFSRKREAVAFLTREIKAGRFNAPDLMRKHETRKEPTK